MQSVMRSESGKQVRMSGDAKVQDRSEKRNDLVEQFSQSRKALKRAMEKDIQTVRKPARAQGDDTPGTTRIVEEHDANATRLAALLEAARNQEAMPPADAASAPRPTAEPLAARTTAAPVVLPSLERHPDLISRPDVGGRPETKARPIVEPVLPPLVGREEEIETVSPVKVAFRLAVLAIIIGAAAYSYLVPKEKDATGLVPGSTAVAPVTPSEPRTDPATEHGVTGGSGVAAETTPPVSDEVSPAVPVKAPTSDSETAASAAPASVREVSASAVHSPPAPAAPVVPANIRPPVSRTKAEIPAPPEPAIVRPSRASKVEKVPTPVKVEPTVKAVPTPVKSESTVKAVSTATPAAVAPPSSTAAGAEAGTATTAITPPAPPPEIPLAENPPPAPVASADAAISLQPPADAPRAAPAVVDRRPYFQRLGPTPARNPFRSVPQAPQSPAPISRSFYDIE